MKSFFSLHIFGLVAFVQSRLYIADRPMTRMIQLTKDKPFCHIYTDSDFIRATVNGGNGDKVKLTTQKEIYKLEKICSKKQVQSSYQGGFIYPGTKWCGPGSAAANFSDLGTHIREDMCCREHDNCENFIEKGQCRGKLCNSTPFTRSHCDCDDKFKRCLQDANSETGNTIGAIFFNIGQVICFKPQASCARSGQNTKHCEMEFTLNDRYIPSETIHYYRTKGEVVEKYFNRALKKLNFL